MTDSSYVDLSFLLDQLLPIQQEHLLEYWPSLSPQQRLRLGTQIAQIDIPFFLRQQALLQNPQASHQEYTPLSPVHYAGDNPAYAQLGFQLLQRGKVGCVVLAGGQGSRLKFDGPKGLYPVSSVKKKPLYQLVAEKVAAASKWVGRPLPLAIMTSPLNHKQTFSYFATNNYFNLSPSQVDFFCQPLWPLLSLSGDLFLESEDRLSLGPTGNGCLSTLLQSSGIWDKWHQAGIEMVSVIPIDNPLALPFDRELVGFHAAEHNDVTIKTTLRQSAQEDVGVLIELAKQKIAVVEYSTLTTKERCAKTTEGDLTYKLANIGLYCLSMDFLAQTAYQPLPLYKANKHAKQLHPSTTEKNAWKFEEFIFDLFQYSEHSQAIVYPRHECFAPLKNYEGNHSPATVREAMRKREHALFTAVTERKLSPNTIFELEADFYYPSSHTSLEWETKIFFQETIIEAS
ncbi:UTP--glucose-1-phosphate uridylyltransferase [Chlamydia trachomatis]|uniref:UTP--glucose-1-phosphate uridylyltransferase n=1 Tax=Chlamydia trachomatis TaxID=813 RepID=UPI0001B5A25C|nr:UTP--glucose-1-phosphate uridylyltransferase [Chlamydia trachomatis]AGT64687.1 UDP-N-acetylglucosamine pyrophosphorylase [Chlamydia trachomatis]AGT65616.1 UDP-N-acetylglucosamine pyrophosphorylase [Chlamydia trachomatis]AGT67471.1 UDP-N-acetylglucosamine pyrophosphorylase [Chlamydia trachomatis F/11-96]AGT69324.1 UDP-N-acetylglucosamine pyrophosphorylase [Chlamydia trachomatis]ANI66840.1 UDP-N-acetylglucosamine pyrophosphorylase [Chlamydia trachomatis]